MVLGTKENDSYILNIGKNKIENSTQVTLMGVKIDKQLKFKTHIQELGRKASKLHALRRIRNYLTVEKAKLLANPFINSQFIYVPLSWMFAGKSSIAKICKIHFRTLQVVYDNYEAIEIYKLLLNMTHEFMLKILLMNYEFMWKFFSKNLVQYNSRKRDTVYLPPVMELIPWLSLEVYPGVVFPII